MTYVASVVSAVRHHSHDASYGHRNKSFIAMFWRFVRIPYWLTVFVTIVYIIEFNQKIGRLLIYSGYLTLLCALISLGAWLLTRDNSTS